jgi:hypothetical protein
MTFLGAAFLWTSALLVTVLVPSSAMVLASYVACMLRVLSLQFDIVALGLSASLIHAHAHAHVRVCVNERVDAMMYAYISKMDAAM